MEPSTPVVITNGGTSVSVDIIATPYVVYYADIPEPNGRIYTQEINDVRNAVPQEIP